MAATTACAADVPATPANLVAMLAQARPGDVVKVTGDLANVRLSGLSFNRPIILDLSGASFSGLTLDNVTNLRVRGGEGRSQSWRGCVYVTGDSSKIWVEGIHCVAPREKLHPGITFRNTSDVSAMNNRLEGGDVQIDVRNSRNVVISGNALWGSIGDGMDLTAVSGGLVENNICAGFAGDYAVLHPDCLQFVAPQKVYDFAMSSKVTVRGNVSHGLAQGFSAFQGAKDVVFEDNLVIGSMPQGVALYKGDGGAVRNNRVRTLAGSQWQAGVRVENSPTATRCGNTVESYGRTPAVTDAPCR